MKKTAARWNLLFRALFVLIMTFAVVEGLNVYFDLQVNVYFIIMAELIMIALVVLIDHFKKKIWLWAVLAGFIIVALSSISLFYMPLREFFSRIGWISESLINWFLAYISKDPLTVLNLYYTLILACAAIAVCVIVLFPLSYNLISRSIVAFFTLAALIALCVLKLPVCKASVCCAVMCIISAVIELCNLQFERRRVNKKSNASLFLYPICAVIALCSIVFPAKEEPIRWQAIRDLCSQVSIDTKSAMDTLKIIFRLVPEEFTISTSDIILSGRKGSLDATRKTTLAYLDINTQTRSSIYLRGNTLSTYTGSGWIDDSEGVFTENEPELETYEVMYAAFREGAKPDDDEDFYHRARLTLTFNDLITKSLFYSPLLLDVKPAREKDVFMADGPDIKFKRMKKIGLEYETSYYETNWGSENFKNYLRSLNGFDYDTDKTTFAKLEKKSKSAYSELESVYGEIDKTIFNYQLKDVLAERANSIEALYKQLPEELPEAVRTLALDICEGCTTDYDKICAIEQYFEDNYTYTLDCEVSPLDRDFVDWFLFETDSGYCTYFATAATVLSRCIGLPARYVEGIRLGGGREAKKDVKIGNLNAHAWTEVYLEGYGWVLLDATPGHDAGRDEEWARKVQTQAPVQTDTSFEDQMLQEAQDAQTPEIEVEVISPEELAAMEAARKAASRRFWLYTSTITTSVLILAVLIFYLCARRARAKRYNRASDNDKIRISMLEVLLVIEISGKRMALSETLSEFVKTLGTTYDMEDMPLSKAVELYLKVRYSSYKAGRYEVIGMYRYSRDIRRKILKKQDLFKRIKYSFKLYV